MTDEEKKAVDYLQLCYDLSTITNESLSKLGIVLNLIEKQSKEIEELKNGQIDFWISDKEIEDRIRNKFTSNDKIKAKIEEYEKLSNNITMQPQIYHYIIEVLQSLLEKE